MSATIGTKTPRLSRRGQPSKRSLYVYKFCLIYSIKYGKGQASGYISTDSLYFDEKRTMGVESALFIAVDPVEAKTIKESSDLWQL